MKRIGLLIFVLAAALCAGAQTTMMVTFSDMPSTGIPTPLPDNYPSGTYMAWDGFYYVSPMMWTGAGPGFFTGPDARVAFLGGYMCKQFPAICSATLKLGVGPTATQAFHPVNMVVSAGWSANNVVVLAYNNGQFVGSLPLKLSTTAHIYSFPANWGMVTQLTFIPSPIPAPVAKGDRGMAGSMVLYTLTMEVQN